MTPVVSKVLQSHALTRVWTGALGTYDAAAKLLPGVKPIQLDLVE